MISEDEIADKSQIRRGLFFVGLNLFGRGNSIQGLIQNPNPDLKQEDLEKCYRRIQTEIIKKYDEAKTFEFQAKQWFNAVKTAFINDELKILS